MSVQTMQTLDNIRLISAQSRLEEMMRRIEPFVKDEKTDELPKKENWVNAKQEALQAKYAGFSY